MGILEDIWNAISSPPGSTTPILAPDTIRSPEEVLEEEIIPIVTEPGYVTEEIIEDVTDVDVDLPDPFKVIAGAFDMGHKPMKRFGILTVAAAAGVGYLLLRD